MTGSGAKWYWQPNCSAGKLISCIFVPSFDCRALAAFQHLQSLLSLLHCAILSIRSPTKFRCTVCTGLLSDEMLSTCMNPACVTEVPLQLKPLFFVPPHAFTPLQHTRTETMELCIASPTSLGMVLPGLSTMSAGEEVTLPCIAMAQPLSCPVAVPSPRLHKTVVSSAGMQGSLLASMQGCLNRFMADARTLFPLSGAI